MTFQIDFENVLVLPMFEGIHQTIIAFLQTSEFGSWASDGSQASNPFKLHLTRGNWGHSFFGFGSNRIPLECNVGNDGRFVPRTKPMLLEITIRPSPHELRVILRHTAFSKVAVRRKDYKEYWTYWDWYVRQEINALRQYLKDCHELADSPRLEAKGAPAKCRVVLIFRQASGVYAPFANIPTIRAALQSFRGDFDPVRPFVRTSAWINRRRPLVFIAYARRIMMSGLKITYSNTEIRNHELHGRLRGY